MTRATSPGGAPVLVVGAGPTGLLLAAELRRRGVPCTLIDDRAGPQHWDRATVVHPRSLEIFESLGLVERFVEVGTPQRGAKIHSDGTVLGVYDLTDCGSTYDYDVGVSEEVTESILTDYLREQGGEVTRSTRLVDLTRHADGVRAEIECDGERSEIEERWVVGCDGLHSPTRESSGIGFEGHDIAAPWAVFDATLQNWPEVYDVTLVYLDPPPVILTALPDRRWRVYLRPSSAQSDLVEDATGTLHRYYPAVSLTDIENPTRFHCHTKVAVQFRAGPVLLAGDAAHLCSPAQGHGMNTGLQDAFNLAWKLALVHHGVADPALLDSYEVERRPVAALVGEAGDEFEGAQTLTDPVERDRRNQAMRGMFTERASRHHEAVAHAELDLDCSGSPIVTGDANASLGPGQRLPFTIAIRSPDDGTTRLHELTRRAGHTLVLLGGPDTDGAALLALFDDLRARTGTPLFEAAVALGAGPDLPHGIGSLEPGAAGDLGVDGITLLAVRPDGYVGLRADHDHLGALERYRTLVVGHP